MGRANKILNDAGKFAPFLIEAFGTFFYVLVTCMTRGGALPAASALAVLVYAGGHISGGHYNPAVSLGVFLTFRGKLKAGNLAVYMFVQFLFGLLGAFLAWGLLQVTYNPGQYLFGPSNDPIITPLLVTYHWYEALFCEFFYTFLLITVVLNTATTRSQEGNSFFGFAIGLTLFAAMSACRYVSGGMLNPAIASGALVVNAINVGDWDALESIWIYWLGPFLASLFAGLFFIITNRKEYNRMVEDDEYTTLN